MQVYCTNGRGGWAGYRLIRAVPDSVIEAVLSVLPEKRRDKVRSRFGDQPQPQVAAKYHHNAATLASFMEAKVLKYDAKITHVRVSLNPAPECTLRCAAVDVAIDGRKYTITIYFTQGIGSRLKAKRELAKCAAIPLKEPVVVEVERMMVRHDDD